MIGLIQRVYNSVKYRFWYFKNQSRYKSLGKGSYINCPLTVHGPENIEVGESVYIGYKAFLGSLAHTGKHVCILKFGDGCAIGNFNHIYATKKIVFGKKVLTADRVYISDNLHEFENISIPILDQPIKQVAEVNIGDGCWIGENVCIIGASVGKNSVIGANSVVTKNIPDYCVAVGSPAKIIKRYSFESKSWEKTSPDGNFLK